MVDWLWRYIQKREVERGELDNAMVDAMKNGVEPGVF